VFYLAANNSIKTCPESRNYYDRKRSEGKRHSQAVLCLAPRRLNVLWTMQRWVKSMDVVYGVVV